MTSLSVFHYLMCKDLLSGYKAAFCVSSGRNSLVWRSQEGQVAYFYVTALSFLSNRRQRVGRMDIVMVYGTMLQLPALRKEEPKQALGGGVAFCWGLWNFCSILHLSVGWQEAPSSVGPHFHGQQAQHHASDEGPLATSQRIEGKLHTLIPA